MTTVRKAVIPAAGLGTRFLPATKATPKEMLPVVDKPAIQYVVEEAVAAGITDVLVITSGGKKTIEDHFDRAYELEARLAHSGKGDLEHEVRAIADLADFHFVRQGEPRGLGHAIGVARAHVGDEPFAVLLPDDLMRDATVLTAMLRASAERGASVVALKSFPPEEISAYGSVAHEPAGPDLVRILDMVEKPAPQDAPSDLAIMGRYVLTPAIFDCIDRVQPGAGGEIQITDAMALLLADQPIYGHVFEHGRFDIGQKLDYLRAVIELALERDDVGPPLRALLREVAQREGLVR
jgi:UTP--glucose-1-phosphate uridylyltransferase